MAIEKTGQVGKAGDPLPPFKAHMIRQRVTRHGEVFDLAAAAELPGCCMAPHEIGVPKEGPVGKWLAAKKQWDSRFASARTRVHKRRLKDLRSGFETFGPGEYPPPSALAGRRKIGADLADKKRTRSYGMSLWSIWGSKHDEMTMEREKQADKEPETKAPTKDEGEGARDFQDIQAQKPAPKHPENSRSVSRRRIVRDENQTEGDQGTGENTHLSEHHDGATRVAGERAQLLTPDYQPDTGVTGKRPYVDGIAVPFSLGKEAETASMLTLNSAMDPSRMPTPRPMSPESRKSTAEQPPKKEAEAVAKPTEETGKERHPVGAADVAVHDEHSTPTAERPALDTFVTAAEDLPTVAGAGKQEAA